jgi:hypothetical protein
VLSCEVDGYHENKYIFRFSIGGSVMKLGGGRKVPRLEDPCTVTWAKDRYAILPKSGTRTFNLA